MDALSKLSVYLAYIKAYTLQKDKAMCLRLQCVNATLLLLLFFLFGIKTADLKLLNLWPWYDTLKKFIILVSLSIFIYKYRLEILLYCILIVCLDQLLVF